MQVNKIDFLKYTNGLKVYDIDGYYSNGEIMLQKRFCKEIPEDEVFNKPAENITAEYLINKTTEYLNYVSYEDNEELGLKMIIQPVYIDFINELLKDPDNTDYIANKYSAVKIVNNGNLIALVMPKKIPLNPEQINMLMINDFKEYLAYADLIPVEYKLEGQEGTCGFFFPRQSSDEDIKRFIKAQVKHRGGRWLGKFERRPDLEDKYILQVQEYLNKCDRSKILKDMNKAVRKGYRHGNI